jgi:hypothetical protein
MATQTTKKQCLQWIRDTSKNPKSNRTIKKDGPTYKALEEACKIHKVLLQHIPLPSTSTMVQISNIETAEDIFRGLQYMLGDSRENVRINGDIVAQHYWDVPIKKGTKSVFVRVPIRLGDNTIKSMLVNVSNDKSLQDVTVGDVYDIHTRFMKRLRVMFKTSFKNDKSRHGLKTPPGKKEEESDTFSTVTVLGKEYICIYITWPLWFGQTDDFP